jgi:hypothetical protein
MTKRPTILSRAFRFFLLAASIIISRAACAEGLEEVKKAFDKVMVNYCELDFVQAQGAALPMNSPKLRELEEAWYSGMKQAEARTKTERQTYNALLAKLTEDETAVFAQYAQERRDACRKDPHAIH